MTTFKRILKYILYTIIVFVIVVTALSYRKTPDHISYGVTFGKLYSDQLDLPFEKTFISILDDMKVRKFRLVAYWQLIEPQQGTYDFKDLDFEVAEAQKRDSTVILAIGRRVPRWPECHIPDWAKSQSWADQKSEILSLLQKEVEHYKSYPAIKYWQVENEPFLTVFSPETCGPLDTSFLKEEVALVKKLDPSRPVLVTDSGNLGLWAGAWRAGDAFGTSVYMYLWNPQVGQVKSIFFPSFYRLKTNVMSILFGSKPSFLIELSLEPWLIEPVTKVSIDEQLTRMDATKFDEIISFAKGTDFAEQYLWGVEWWYWMQNHGHPEFLEKAKGLFQ
jgi:hypothetical protein